MARPVHRDPLLAYEPVRETVRRMTPEEGLSMTWDDAEAYVLPGETEKWEYIKQHTAVPFDALRKLKGFL